MLRCGVFLNLNTIRTRPLFDLGSKKENKLLTFNNINRRKQTLNLSDGTCLKFIPEMALLTQEQVQGMRKPYRGKQEVFDIDNLVSKDPLEQFKAWFNEAAQERNGIYEANAMTLATASKEGRPSCRMVLLKGYDENGFKFYSNYGSRKARELGENPHAALQFYWTVNEPEVSPYSRQSENPFASLQFFWEPFMRAVRIEGTVEKLTKEESDEYFHSRPKASQIGAVVSHQSTVVESRHILDTENVRLEKEYLDTEKEIPRPSEWGGYRVRPSVMEFWQGQTNRIHDRLVFRKPVAGEKLDSKLTHQAANGWVLERLSP